MNFLHLTVWSSRARLTSDVVLLCKEAPSTVWYFDIFGSSLLSEKAEAGPSSNLPSAFQKLLVNTGWKYILKRIHVKICHKKCLPSFNELARFSQFIKYTHFLVPFFCCQKPLLVPISLKIRSPFWKIEVPFPCGSGDIDIECILVYCFYILVFLYCSICPLLAGAHDARHSLPRFPRLLFCKECQPIVCARHNGGDNNVVICCWMLSVFSYIVFICLYFHIFVLCISISVSFCCFLIFCIFRFFVPLVHGARDCLLLWTPFKKHPT